MSWWSSRVSAERLRKRGGQRRRAGYRPGRRPRIEMLEQRLLMANERPSDLVVFPYFVDENQPI